MPTLEIDGQTVTVEDGLNLDPGRRAARDRDPALLLPPRPDRSPATAACAWSRSRRCRSCRSPATRGWPTAWWCARSTERREERARGGARVPAPQPPDRLPDLRPGRRVQAAGLLHGLRPAAEPVAAARTKVKKDKALDIGPLVMLDQERCILCTRCMRFLDEVTKTERARRLRARRPLPDRSLPRHAGSTTLLGQRRRHLPGRRADQQGLPLPRPRLVPRAHAVGVPDLRDRAATSTSTTGAARCSASGRATTTTSTSYWMCDEGRLSYKRFQGEGRLLQPVVRDGEQLARAHLGASRRSDARRRGCARSRRRTARAPSPASSRHRRRTRRSSSSRAWLRDGLTGRVAGFALVAAGRVARRLPDRRRQESRTAPACACGSTPDRRTRCVRRRSVGNDSRPRPAADRLDRAAAATRRSRSCGEKLDFVVVLDTHFSAHGRDGRRAASDRRPSPRPTGPSSTATAACSGCTRRSARPGRARRLAGDWRSSSPAAVGRRRTGRCRGGLHGSGGRRSPPSGTHRTRRSAASASPLEGAPA